MTGFIVQLVDENVDGCGTDVSTLAIIQGDAPYLMPTDITGVQNAISARKEQLAGEYTTDDCLHAAEAYLKSVGYDVEFVFPSDTITF